MSDLLNDLEPKLLWRYFLELSRIPRGSKREAEAARWVAEQGRALGCEVATDALGNVLIRKAGTKGREGRPGVCLQGHVDMVCEKNEGTPHDFTRDPIAVYRDGDVVRAWDDLGADNGIGVAAGSRRSRATTSATDRSRSSSRSTRRPGSRARRGSRGWLRSRYLLNLDSEEEGELTIGCAGGVDTVATRKVELSRRRRERSRCASRSRGSRAATGIDIAAGRGNSPRSSPRCFRARRAARPRDRGGERREQAERHPARGLCDGAGRGRTRGGASRRRGRLGREWRAALGAFDPNLAVDLEPGTAERVLAPADARAVVGLLLAGPHGVEAMSPTSVAWSRPRRTSASWRRGTTPCSSRS